MLLLFLVGASIPAPTPSVRVSGKPPVRDVSIRDGDDEEIVIIVASLIRRHLEVFGAD